MRPAARIGGSILLLALAACQGKPLATPAHPAGLSPRPAATSGPDTVAPAASSKPSPVASAAASAAPAPRGLLRAPATDSVTLAGVVTLDAGYVVSAGAGSLISNNAGSVLAAGASSLSSSGQLLSNNGSSIIAGNTGNLISDSGGAIVSDQGAGLVSNNSAGLKARFGLLDAAASGPAAPAVGAQLPAAGVEVRVESLLTGQPLPLGVDGAGQPVYAIYTDLSGRYTLYLPSDEPANVLVRTRVPQVADVRVAHDVLSQPGAPAAAINDDSGLTSRDLRQLFAGHLLAMMADDTSESLCSIASSKNISAGIKASLMANITELHTKAQAAGVTRAPDRAPAVEALALRCADILIASLDLAQVKLDASSGVTWGVDPLEKPKTATQAIEEALKQLREAAAAKLAADPHYFDTRPYLVESNACAPGRYAIREAADLPRYVVDDYLSNDTDPGLYHGGLIFSDVGAHLDADGVVLNHKLNIAFDALAGKLALILLADQHGEHAQLEALVKAFDPRYVPPAGGDRLPALPCPRASVDTPYKACGASADPAATPVASPSLSPTTLPSTTP